MSSALNVVRWTALVSGIAYGIVHKRTLQKQWDHTLEFRHNAFQTAQIEHAHHLYKEKLANKGKKVEGPISDPEDPKFDLDKYVEWATAGSA
ncbi:hypothetical protein BDY24DRAFT_418798 [Mrakia frigida]|uniref:uncharacterized protein n=1 Tax=Mrakia frigida TaxID=29902 RepID=UPI003FCC0BD9